VLWPRLLSVPAERATPPPPILQALSRHNLVNLITSETDSLWRSVNRAVGPSFTQDNLLRMYSSIQDVWSEVVASARTKCGPDFVDVDRIMTVS